MRSRTGRIKGKGWVHQLLLLVWCQMFILATASGAIGQEKKTPILQLDTGGHMALVRDMVFTADGARLISASDDKTIRIWDIKKKRTVQILRGQIDFADGGKIYEIALSPDGRYLAAAGHTGVNGAKLHPVRLYDLQTGEIVRLFSGHSEAVLSVSFSGDGRFLASAGMDDSAIVWRVSDGRKLQRVRHPAGDINVVRLTHKGERMFTGGDDSQVRMWQVRDGRLLSTLSGHEKLVRDITLSPDEKTVVTSATGGGIRIWNARTGRFLRQLAKLEVSVPRLRFTPDGKRLLSGIGGAPFESKLWNVASGQSEIVYRGHDNIVLSVAISPDGKFAATAGGKNNEIHIWTLNSPAVIAVLKGKGRAVHAVGVSQTGNQIAWGYGGQFENPNDVGPLEMTLRLPEQDRSLGEPRKLDPSISFARNLPAQLRGQSLDHESRGPFGYWDTLNISKGSTKLGRAERGEKDGYTHNAYGFLPGGLNILSAGGHGWISAYDLKGRKLLDYNGHSGDVWTLAVSRGGELLVSGSDDQTVRLWNTKTGENIVSLFHASDAEWVIWTPQGYFAASPDGDDHIGWHVNEGPGQAVRLITAAQLKRHFYRPDIVRRALQLMSAVEALKEAPDVTFRLNQLLNRKPPEMKILSPQAGQTQEAATVQVRVQIAANLDPVQKFELAVNGRRINLDPISLSDGAGFEALLPVPLQVGDNAIEISATNAVGASTASLRIARKGKAPPAAKGVLYMVAVGVDDYTHFDQDLKFAGADAKAFLKALTERSRGLYRRIETLTIAKGGALEPTTQNIHKALGIFKNAQPEDTVILFLAGHGINQGADYLFLPGDAKFNAKAKTWEKASVIDWRQLHSAIDQAQGRRIMVVDTCKAGNAYNPRLIKDADDAFVTVLAATDAETLAQERPSLGHGVFTYSILQGLDGKADAEPDRKIKLRELADFVTANVKKLTDGKQEPTARLPRKENFVISSF